MQSLPTERPELLSPAGDWECVRAAVENGADAVYFGLDCGFNARARAANFSRDDLPELMTFLHRRGVKGFVTFNTLVFSDELESAEEVLREIASAAVDAVLVQDLGVLRLIRAVCPDLPIHASTQMTLTSAQCIEAVQELGVERVVLARELSIDEIRKVSANTPVELEAFVHGALCVAYSGQCLTSESLGNRSANRGQCAQACRLPYELICDGQDVELGDVKYLLSPQDLAAFSLVPEMIAAGVCSFKIEGRLKTPEYVANITRRYREAIDAAIAKKNVQFPRRQIREMELSFSRGFSPGWLGGCDHKMLVPGLSSAKRGVLLGVVTRINGPRVEIRLQEPVAAGDGIVFEGDRASGDEQGGRVYEVFAKGKLKSGQVERGIVELTFAREAIDTGQLAAGQQIWKTDDPRLTRQLRKTFTGADPVRRLPVDLHVQAATGQRLRIAARTGTGATCGVVSEMPLAAATKHPLSTEVLVKQLGRLGGTVYQLRDLTADIQGGPLAPLSVLGQLRHELVRQLDDVTPRRPARRIADHSVLPALRGAVSAQPADKTRSPELRVMCREMSQLRAALQCDVKSIFADFQDIREYREAVQVAHDAGAEIYLATPRIQKPGEMGIFRALLRHGADGILVRNLAGLRYFLRKEMPIVADYSLNAANELTVQYLRQQGARRVTASYDLNREQLLNLVAAAPPDAFEVVVHQHMPMFHMEHCVFCAVLSPGTNKTNCGRPCDDHKVELRDRIGMQHPLKADVGCRNTLYNATPQSAAEVVPALLEQGVRDFRVELLENSDADIGSVIRLYRELLAGRVTGGEVWRQLNAANRVGVTRGTLEERRNQLAIL